MGKEQVELPYFPVFVQGESRAEHRCQTLCKRLQWSQHALCHCGWTPGIYVDILLGILGNKKQFP